MLYMSVQKNTAKKAKLLKSHFHNNEYEIYYLKKGKMRYIIADKIFELTKNDVALIPKGVIHNTSYIGEETERFLINFSSDEITNPKLLSCFEKQLISLSEKEGFEFERIYKRLEKESFEKDEFSDILIKQCINELLISFARKEKKEASVLLEEYSETMQRAVEYINLNFVSDISLESISKKFSLSKSFFSRKFKEVTGFGFSEYITLVRIKNAEKLLLEGNTSITEIAFASGFNDSSYFTLTFKKLIGVTPLKYAKLKLNNSD